MYDVTIVGAGPGGSTAAKFLSEKGFKVLLLDKDKFPRDKPCGGGLTANVLKRYKHFLTEDMIESYSYGGFTYSPSLKYKLDFETTYPVTGMTLRKKFDYGLVKIAVENGSTFKEKKKVIDFKISNEKAIVFLDDQTKIESQIVIGADGVWSIIAKKAGLRPKNIPIGVCVVEEYELTEDLIDEYFGKLRKGYIHSKFQNLFGYGWVFPKKKHLNIGVGEIEYNPQKQIKVNLKNVYENYLNLLKKQKLIPNQIKIKKLKGGALPVYPLKKTYRERVLLVGDAAGFINPSSGEGIYYAMISGEIAAKTIQKALSKNDTSEIFLRNYQKSWKKEFGKELKLFYWISKRQRRTKSEKNFRLLYNDKKLNQLLADVSSGFKSINEYKWKILKRYIYGSLKDIFSKSQDKIRKI
jgi:geranylgeranyl reductase family protein